MDATPPDKFETADPKPHETPRSSQHADHRDLAWLVRLFGGFVLIVVSSLIAFVMTCVPLGFPNLLPSRPPDVPPPFPEWLPWVAGVVVGVGVGIGVGMFWVRWNRWVDRLPPSASDGSNH